MKVVVDFDKCDSHAICMSTCPDVFEVRDDGFLYILDETPGEDQRDAIEQAAANCPTGAITIEG